MVDLKNSKFLFWKTFFFEMIQLRNGVHFGFVFHFNVHEFKQRTHQWHGEANIDTKHRVALSEQNVQDMANGLLFGMEDNHPLLDTRTRHVLRTTTFTTPNYVSSSLFEDKQALLMGAISKTIPNNVNTQFGVSS